MGHDACTSCVSGLLIETWAEFQQSVADDAIAGEKTGSVYHADAVTLNTCRDVACLH